VAAHEAARGQIVYITEHGNRVAGIVPVELAAILDRLTTDELDQLAAAAELARLTSAAGLMEDLAGRTTAASCTRLTTIAGQSGWRTCGTAARYTVTTDTERAHRTRVSRRCPFGKEKRTIIRTDSA
jgi:antitoxin (DNA-binding transcriptional repressor) of toxin-antitoxin stability system